MDGEMTEKPVTPERVLITGGSGFIGTHLIEHHRSHGDVVLNLDVRPPRDPAQMSFWQRCDLLDRDGTATAVADFAPDRVYHLGARTDFEGRTLADYRVNTVGVRHMVRACQRLPASARVVFASSRMVCRIGYRPRGERDYAPDNVYGESKCRGERIVRSADLACGWAIVRPTSIWGPWFDIPYRNFFIAVAKGRYVHPRNRPVHKSFGYVGNTVHELTTLCDNAGGRIRGRTLYVGDYPPIEVSAMATAIAEASGAKPVRHVPMPVLSALALAGDAAKRLGWIEPPLTSYRLSNLLSEMVYDLSPISELVGPLPYSTQEGIRATVSWMRDASLIR